MLKCLEGLGLIDVVVKLCPGKIASSPVAFEAVGRIGSAAKEEPFPGAEQMSESDVGTGSCENERTSLVDREEEGPNADPRQDTKNVVLSLTEYFTSAYAEGQPYRGHQYVNSGHSVLDLSVLKHSTTGISVWVEAVDLRPNPAETPCSSLGKVCSVEENGSLPDDASACVAFFYCCESCAVSVSASLRVPETAASAVFRQLVPTGSLRLYASEPEALAAAWYQRYTPDLDGLASEPEVCPCSEYWDKNQSPKPVCCCFRLDESCENPIRFCIPVIAMRNHCSRETSEFPTLATNGHEIAWQLHVPESHLAMLDLAWLSNKVNLVKYRFEFLRRTQGERDVDTLISWGELSDLLWAHGERLESIRNLREFLPVAETIYGLYDRITVHALETLGRRCQAELLFDGAVKTMEQALCRRRHVLGNKHPTTLRLSLEFGKCLLERGSVNAAEEILRNTHDSMVEEFGQDSQDAWNSTEELAIAFRILARFPEAMTLQKNVTDWRKAVLGNAHFDTVKATFNLGVLHLSLKNYVNAEAALASAAVARQELFGLEDVDTAESLSMLATAYQELGRYDEAEQVHKQVQEMIATGRWCPKRLRCADSYAVYLRLTGKFSEAKKLQTEVFGMRGKVLGNYHPETLQSCNNLAVLFREMGDYVTAESHQEMAFKALNEIWAPDHPDMLQALANQGVLLHALGNHVKSEDILRKVWVRRNVFCGAGHSDTLQSKEHLANVLRSMGRFAEAEPMLVDAVETLTKSLGYEHPQTLSAFQSKLALWQAMGYYRKAETQMRQVLVSREKILGDTHPQTLTSVQCLASLLRSLGLHGEAVPLQRRALENREKVLGPKHPDTLESFNNLVALLTAIGEFADAELHQRRALEGLKFVVGDRHPLTLQAVNNLATLLVSLGKHQEALPMLRQVLKDRRETLGDQHPHYLASMNNLGGLLRLLGKLKEAEVLLRLALTGRETVLGAHHPQTLASANSLASLLWNSGKFVEAETVQRQSCKGRQVVLGEKHPQTLAAFNNLSGILRSLSRFAEAEEIQRTAAAGLMEVMGPSHPHTLTAYGALAMLVEENGDKDCARKIHRNVLDNRLKTLGGKHPDTLTSLNNLGVLEYTLGNSEEATKLLRRACEGLLVTLGPEHAQTLTCKEALATTFQSTGNLPEAERLFSEVLLCREMKLGDQHPDTATARHNLHSLLKAVGRADDPLLADREEASLEEAGVRFIVSTQFSLDESGAHSAVSKRASLEESSVQFVEASQVIPEVSRPKFLDTAFRGSGFSNFCCRRTRKQEFEDTTDHETVGGILSRFRVGDDVEI